MTKSARLRSNSSEKSPASTSPPRRTKNPSSRPSTKSPPFLPASSAPSKPAPHPRIAKRKRPKPKPAPPSASQTRPHFLPFAQLPRAICTGPDALLGAGLAPAAKSSHQSKSQEDRACSGRSSHRSVLCPPELPRGICCDATLNEQLSEEMKGLLDKLFGRCVR